MNKTEPVLSVQSERLVLRPNTVREMQALAAGDPDPELRQAYREMLAEMERLPGREYWAADWAVLLPGGERVGGVGFKGAPGPDGAVELGYGIDQPYRCRGYATEAVGAMLRWALAQPGVRCVLGQTEPDNLVSQRVLLRNGFVPCGTGPEGPLFAVRRREPGGVQAAAKP